MNALFRLSMMFVLAFALALPCAVQAAAPAPAAQQVGRPVPDKPAQTHDRTTAVAVVADGTDSIGARLATRLKERFNQSSLFRLTDEQAKDGQRLNVLLSTQPEFASRPGVGSVYGVCWAFSQGKDYLNLLLAREVGTVNAEDIDALVDRLVERTDGLAAKYSNLWK